MKELGKVNFSAGSLRELLKKGKIKSGA